MPATYSNISKPPGAGRITPVLMHTQNSSGNWTATLESESNGYFSPIAVSGISIEAGTGVQQITTLHASTEYVLLDIKSGDLFVRYDGVDPVYDPSGMPVNGHVIPAGTPTTWNRATANVAKFINGTGASTHVFVSQLV